MPDDIQRSDDTRTPRNPAARFLSVSESTEARRRTAVIHALACRFKLARRPGSVAARRSRYARQLPVIAGREGPRSPGRAIESLSRSGGGHIGEEVLKLLYSDRAMPSARSSTVTLITRESHMITGITDGTFGLLPRPGRDGEQRDRQVKHVLRDVYRDAGFGTARSTLWRSNSSPTQAPGKVAACLLSSHVILGRASAQGACGGRVQTYSFWSGVRTVFASPLAYTAAAMRFSRARRVSAGIW
jgi:hypothetical protein